MTVSASSARQTRTVLNMRRFNTRARAAVSALRALASPLQSQRIVVRAASLSQVGRRERAAEFPDEVHLGVQRLLRDARLFNKKHAAVEEPARAEEPERDGEPGPTLSADR